MKIFTHSALAHTYGLGRYYQTALAVWDEETQTVVEAGLLDLPDGDDLILEEDWADPDSSLRGLVFIQEYQVTFLLVETRLDAERPPTLVDLLVASIDEWIENFEDDVILAAFREMMDEYKNQ